MIEESQKTSETENGDVQKLLKGLKSVSIRDVIEVLSKVVIVFVGGCYVIRLLIVNLHLKKYAFSNLGFLQVDYVMAGVVWLFLVGLVVAFVLYLLSKLAAIGEDLTKSSVRMVVTRIGASVTYVVLAFSIIIYAVILLSDHAFHILSITTLTILGLLIPNVCG